MRNMKYYRFFVFLFLFNFQVFADEFAHQLVVVAAGEGVGRAWIDHLVKLNLSILQSQRKAPGVGRMDVSEVGRQRQHLLVDIGIVGVPAEQPPDGEGVAQVVQTGRLVSTSIDPAEAVAQADKDAVHLSFSKR